METVLSSEARLLAINQQLHNLRRKRRRGEALVDRCGFRLADLRIAHFLLGECGTEVARAYLLRRRTVANSCSRTQLASDRDVSRLLANMGTLPVPAILRTEKAEATRFALEWSSVQWLQSVNEGRGAAPSSSTLRRRLEKEGFKKRGANAFGCWMNRFRRRWRVRFKCLRSQPKVSLDHVQMATRTFFQWLDFVSMRAPGDRRVVWLNFDETNIPYGWQKQRGNVAPVSPAALESASPNVRTERLESSSCRGSYTYLGFSSSDPRVQKALVNRCRLPTSTRGKTF